MEPKFEVAGRVVGADSPVFVVAELSANHGGSLERGLASVEAAARAGADAIKVQTYTPDTLTLRSSEPAFVVQTANEWRGRTLHDLYAEAMTPWEWHEPLRRSAESLGLVFFSTPFDYTASQFLSALGVPAFKIASFELVDLPLIEHTARFGKPMILSTGMASFGEIDSAVAACRAAGNNQLALLRCVSSYPARPESMNLRSIEVLRSFRTVVGLSDHTRDFVVAVAAVALGAKIVEKHFTLDRAAGGPDAFFSLEPPEFRAMVDAIRKTEAAMGEARFGPADEEKASTRFRRSLFVTRDVKEGEVLTADNVRSIRPSDGMQPRDLPEVLGQLASRPLSANTPLTPDGVTQAPSTIVRIRTSAASDGSKLLSWRNDPITRASSFNQGEVTESEHRVWLEAALKSVDRKLYIAEVEGEAIGQLRLDKRKDGVWEVSITIAPEARGKAFASLALRAVEKEARTLGVSVLTARIRADNHRSLRVFKLAGYYGFVEDKIGDMSVCCERRIAPY